MARADEAVEAQVRRLEQRPQRRHDRDVVAEARRSCGSPSAFARISVSAVDGAVVSKPIGEEDDLAVRVLARDPQRVERRVDHADVRAVGLRVEQRAVAAGHAHHVAEAGEDHAGLVRDGDRRRRRGPSGSRRPGSRGRGRARRSPAAGRRRRTCRSCACARRRPPSPCSGGPARRSRRSRPRARARARRRGTRRRTSCAASASGERRRARAPRRRARRADEIGHDLAASPRPRARSARARRASASTTRIGTPSSEQVMQWSPRSQAVTRSRSPSAPRAPARSRRPCPAAVRSVAAASSSSTFESAKPTWISTQSPGCGAVAVAIEQADVDGAHDAGDIHPGEPVRLVHELDDLTQGSRDTYAVGRDVRPASQRRRVRAGCKIPLDLLRI